MDWIDPPNEEEAQDLARLRALRKQVAEASERADRVDAKVIQKQLAEIEAECDQITRGLRGWGQ